MADITITAYQSYIGGTASDHAMVGFASGTNYCVRFGPFTAPASGATGVSISGQFGDGQGNKAGPSWYITESADSHANAGVGAVSHGILTMTLSAGVYVGTGSASVTLKPGGSYYLWLFPSVAEYGLWGHYKSITITTSGSTTVTITEYHYGIKADGSFEPLETTTHTAAYGSIFVPVARTGYTAYTSSGSTYNLWNATHTAVAVEGKRTGTDGFAVDGTYHTWVDVFYPLRTYKLSISAGTGSEITVKRGGTTLANGATISHGDVLTISFGTSTGYDLESHTVNGSAFVSGGTHTVAGAVTVEATAALKTYKLSISAGVGSTVTVKRGGSAMANGATVTHGDVLTIVFVAAEGYCLTTHTVNGAAFDSGDTHTVAGAVAVAADAEVLGYAIGTELYHAYIGDDAGGSLYVAYIGDENGIPVPYGQIK